MLDVIAMKRRCHHLPPVVVTRELLSCRVADFLIVAKTLIIFRSCLDPLAND